MYCNNMMSIEGFKETATITNFLMGPDLCNASKMSFVASSALAEKLRFATIKA